ncbi:MAG: type 11 methyltransferase [Bellilinea sp.]|nr:MAG: type 11 methyltransferase [Bellilinea sp.]
MGQTSSIEKDFLWLNIRELPYFRGMLRAVEARFYQIIELNEPVLDLGCGDGHFASIAFEKPLTVGLDPWWNPVREAARRSTYRLTLRGSGSRMPFKDETFASVVSNSVLEHITDLNPVLEETARVLKTGGLFVFCVPNHRFLENLSIARLFDQVGLTGMAQQYRRFFNRISRHYHCDDFTVWKNRLHNAGFEVLRHWDYFSPRALAILEWGHYFGLPSLIMRWLFKRWILVSQPWNLAITRKICEGVYLESPEQDNGVYSFYVARKTHLKNT